MVSRENLNAMVRAIHTQPELQGCIVGFQGNGQSSVLHAGLVPSLNFGRVAVIIEEFTITDDAINEDSLRWAASPSESHATAPNPLVTNRSMIKTEAVGAGIACTLAAVSVVGVVAGAAAEIPSAGTSTILVVAGWTGLVTAGIQCVNGVVRVAAAVSSPDDNSLQRWDSGQSAMGQWYPVGILIVDALGVVSGLASLPSATRNLWAIVVRMRAGGTRPLTEAALRSMNAAQREAAIAEAFREASKTEEGLKALVAAAREAQIGAATLGGRNSLSVRNATKLVQIIDAETVKRLNMAILSAISVPVGTIASGLPSSAVGSASGSVNWVVNIIDVGSPESI